MNAVEQILYNALQENPDDWTVRFELLNKLQAGGSAPEVLRVISEATSAPATEPELEHVVRFATEAGQPGVAEPILSAFVAQKPSGAVGHQLLAKVLVKTGDLDKAREHYNTAVALKPEMADDVLAVRLADLGDTIPQPAAEADQVIAQLSTPEPEPEIAPVSPPAQIASPLTPPPGKAIPAPAPAAAPVEEPEETESALAAIPAVEADVAPPVSRLAPVPDLRETAAHMVTPEPFDAHAHLVEQGGAEVVEFENHLHQTRHIVVAGEGQIVKAMEKSSDKNQKMSAVMLALVAHVVLGLLFGLVAMNLPQETPPQIVASSAQVLDQDTMQVQEVQKQVQRKPVQSASSQMEVISVAGASAVSMPDIQTDLISFDPIGMGDAFGASMSFDAGEDGGMVSFFGSKSTSKKVVFVVDYSASMRSQDKDKLMRKELAKSLNALPGGIEYQCIFFSGPVWYHGQEVAAKNNSDMTVKAEKGRDEWRWVGKSATNWWLDGNEDGDPDKLPKGEYVSSTRSNIRKSIKHVEETKLVYGTDWRSPLYMAMNMRPDTIFFMTDGAYGGGQKVLDDLIKHNNRSGRAKINTICLMVPQAMDKLTFIAEKSRGEVSLVLADQTVLRGKELEEYTKKGKKN